MSDMELWWLGQSGFRLRDPAGGPVLFVDPFLTNRDSRRWQSPVQPADLAQADAVLCTHEHIDHFDQPALKMAAATPGSRFTLVVPEPIVDMALALGIPRERIIGARPGQEVRVAGVTVHPVPASHGVHRVDAYSFGQELSGGQVRFLGYGIELGGVCAYHAGDTIPYDGQIEQVKAFHPHLALLPINGRDYFREQQDLAGNMNPREAVRIAVELGVQVLVPMHWDMFTPNLGFPEHVVQYAASEFPELTVLIFGRRQRFIYAPDKA